MKNASRLRLGLAAIALAAALLALFGAASHQASAQAGLVMPAIGSNPQLQNEGVVEPTTQPGPLRGCQTRLTPSAAGSCYGPDQIRVAYGFQPLLDSGIDGAGRTIVIIDAFGSDTLANDLGLFNSYFGLPTSQVNVIYPDGTPLPTSPGNAFGWKAETTLDVEWAHAIAPAATIDLVVAKSNDDADILSATKYVADHNLGDVLSQSYGEAEQCMASNLLTDQHAVFDRLTAQRVTLLASSGDQGAALPSCDGKSYIKATSTPATDPDVTAVGGTQLIATPATADSTGHVVSVGGTYQSENTWNEGVGSSTGGGVSSVYSRPDFQAPVVKDTHMREVPDVAYNAAVNGGVLGTLTCGPTECGLPQNTYFFRFGGTSAGSPQWAGLVALADQMASGRIGAINKTLYHFGQRSSAASLLHDVTVGNNDVPFSPTVPGTPISGFSAVTGYDEATGWGSPIASVLVPELAKPGQG